MSDLNKPARTLGVECVGGVAGDMLLGALVAAGADVHAIQTALTSLGVEGLRFSSESVNVDGEAATYVHSIPAKLRVPSAGHGVHMADVFRTLKSIHLSPGAHARAQRIFRVLGQAESRAHGTEFDKVHLHEVGELDSILDVVGIAIAYESLGCPRLKASPLPSGSGVVQTSHGPLVCPVPAVVEIAKEHNVPLRDVPVKGETITPTGIASLVGLDCTFINEEPPQWGDLVGSGAGTKRFKGRPNVVRIRELKR